MLKTAARKRREEAPGAEEVREDENTAVEIPVDQVTPPFNKLGKFHVINDLKPTLLSNSESCRNSGG